MRMIDADALREHWHISEKCEECHWNNRDCSKPPYYPLRDICAEIDEVPTIDAIPVEWMVSWINRHPNDLRCVWFASLEMEWRKEQEAR